MTTKSSFFNYQNEIRVILLENMSVCTKFTRAKSIKKTGNSFFTRAAGLATYLCHEISSDYVAIIQVTLGEWSTISVQLIRAQLGPRR